MSPILFASLLLAGLVGLIPVWRLRVAGWPTGALLTAWILYGLGILVAVRFPGPFRFLLPILVLAYVAPFVAGPERLTRVLGGRRPAPRVIIDVTPKPAPGLPAPPRDVTPDGADHGAPDAADDGAGHADAEGDQPSRDPDPRDPGPGSRP